MTIAELASQLVGLDKTATIKIMGFNGSTSRSGGKGRMIGLATSREGRKVAIRVPDAHHVPGAPSDLLSVSALAASGYEFHFTKERAWMVTPEMEVVDLEQKAGLYWLKWKRAVDPLTVEVSEMPNKKGADRPHETAVRAEGEATLADSKSSQAVEEEDETLNELGVVESPDLGAAQVESGWAQGAVPLSAMCTSVDCAVCCGIVREREKYVSLDLLHRRLAHFDPALCDKMVSQRSLDVRLLDRHAQSCDVCKANKITRGAVPKQREDDAAQRKPFERVWTDVKGKLLKDFWGNEYMVTFTCEVTRWTCVYFCQRKSQVKERFVEFLAWVKRQGYAVRVLNSDGGGEYAANENAKVLSEFQRVCEDHGITHDMTSPDTSAQNGISERLNRTLVEHAKAILHDAGLAREFWTLAVKHVAWVRNRIWHKALQLTDGAGVSPFQALYGRTPKVSMAKVFGCDAWRLDMTVTKASLEPKGKKGIFVGLSANRKGWLIFDPKTRKTRTSFHCSFDETLEGRRCALRDFDLRQRKAGPGSTKDEERLAMLERELYDEDVDLCLSDDRVHGFREDSKKDGQVVGLDDAGSPGEQEPALDSRQPKGRIASDPVGAGKAPGATVADERSGGDSSGDEVASARRQSGLHLNSGRPENKSRRLSWRSRSVERRSEPSRIWMMRT